MNSNPPKTTRASNPNVTTKKLREFAIRTIATTTDVVSLKKALSFILSEEYSFSPEQIATALKCDRKVILQYIKELEEESNIQKV
ncbi:MAG: HTH domain-containing protein [Deltaproteobacteria bacterium]|jgi:hypothetical protein|nr:HTH domain-containing protein [Deltaproteobacteria bacterium]